MRSLVLPALRWAAIIGAFAAVMFTAAVLYARAPVRSDTQSDWYRDFYGHDVGYWYAQALQCRRDLRP